MSDLIVILLLTNVLISSGNNDFEMMTLVVGIRSQVECRVLLHCSKLKHPCMQGKAG